MSESTDVVLDGGRTHEQTAHSDDGPLPRYLSGERPASWRSLALDCLVVVLLSAVIFVVIFHLWDRSIRSPFDYNGDGLLNEAWIKGMLQNGWINHNPRLGSPFGQTYYDFPLGADNMHFAVFKVMTFFTRDWVLLMNVFYFLTFPTVGLSAYLCQRWLGLPRLCSLAASLIFAFLPMHFIRGEDHVFLASYACVPVVLLLACRSASGILPWEPTVPRGPWATDVVRAVPWLALIVLVASSGAYYFFFGVFVLLVCGACSVIRAKRIRPLLACISVATMAIAVFIINNAPSLLYWRSHGTNQLVAKRSVQEMDLYGMRIVDLFSPQRSSRIPGLSFFSERLLTPQVTSESTQFLGLVASLGLIIMFFTIVSLCLGKRPVRSNMAGLFNAVTFVVVLVATSGGLAWLGNIVGFTQIRAWSRISVFVAFMALSCLCSVIGPHLQRRCSLKGRRRTATFVAVAAVVIVALFDQTPQPVLPHADSGADLRYQSDKKYFAAVEASLQPGASVYELPYRKFPEEPPTGGSEDYDLLRPYLNTQTIRWSYGGMKGRQADWQDQLGGLGVMALAADLGVVGYDGILVDRYGYSDNAAAIEAALTAGLGSAPLNDRTGRWSFFDMRDYRAAQLARDGATAVASERKSLLFKPRIDRTGCYPPEVVGTGLMTWCGTAGSLIVTTETYPRTVRLSAGLLAPAGPSKLTITVGNAHQHFPMGEADTQLSTTVQLTGRITTIHFTTDAGLVDAPLDPRSLHFELKNLSVDGV